MIVTISTCLAFAYQVSFYHDMRKSSVPVPKSIIMELSTDENRDQIVYALSAPINWHRAKVEIWAEYDCENNEKVFTVE